MTEHAFRPLSTGVPSVGSAWAGRVICFKSRPLACTLLAAGPPPAPIRG